MNGSNVSLSISRFRLAPTPSGLLHLGNAASFVLTWLLARQAKGDILLRIDDLDRARFRMEYLEDIFRTIDWLGIDYDRGPSGPDEFTRSWSQSERMESYHAFLSLLIEKSERVFECSCSRSSITGGIPCTCFENQLTTNELNTLRFHTNTDETVAFHDLMKGELSCNINKEMGHFIIRKKDGAPSYQIASICDDLNFGITHIVRGEDLIPSTAAQILLDRESNSNKFRETLVLHHPLIKSDAGQKLSKSAGDMALLKGTRNDHQSTKIIQHVCVWLGISESIGNLNELMDASQEVCKQILKSSSN